MLTLVGSMCGEYVRGCGRAIMQLIFYYFIGVWPRCFNCVCCGPTALHPRWSPGVVFVLMFYLVGLMWYFHRVFAVFVFIGLSFGLISAAKRLQGLVLAAGLLSRLCGMSLQRVV